MDISSILELEFLGISVLAVVIFLSRICDVSLGTMRIVFISRGYRIAASIIGFFEVTIWILAVGQVIRNINTPILLLAYAGGYASGSYLGMYIESKMRLGNVILRIITKVDASELVKYLRDNNYGVTTVEAQGAMGKVHLLFMVLRRKNLEHTLNIVKKYNPRAFLSIEDVRQVQEGNFPKSKFDNLKILAQRK
jgi:uncharacterized protein YebE (UPF0316 family)